MGCRGETATQLCGGLESAGLGGEREAGATQAPCVAGGMGWPPETQAPRGTNEGGAEAEQPLPPRTPAPRPALPVCSGASSPQTAGWEDVIFSITSCALSHM